MKIIIIINIVNGNKRLRKRFIIIICPSHVKSLTLVHSERAFLFSVEC